MSLRCATRWVEGLVSACALLCLTAAAPADAAVVVFADLFPDANMIDDGEALLAAEPGQVLRLYLQLSGTNSLGEACRQGSQGDQICGYHVQLLLEGDGSIQDFEGAAGVEVWPSNFSTGQVQQLNAAFTDAVFPSPDTQLYIGELTVNAAGDGTLVRVTGTKVVDAGLLVRNVPPRTLTDRKSVV